MTFCSMFTKMADCIKISLFNKYTQTMYTAQIELYKRSLSNSEYFK